MPDCKQLCCGLGPPYPADPVQHTQNTLSSLIRPMLHLRHASHTAARGPESRTSDAREETYTDTWQTAALDLHIWNVNKIFLFYIFHKVQQLKKKGVNEELLLQAGGDISPTPSSFSFLVTINKHHRVIRASEAMGGKQVSL